MLNHTLLKSIILGEIYFYSFNNNYVVEKKNVDLSKITYSEKNVPPITLGSSDVQKLEMGWLEPPETGQPYKFYGNKNQQAPIFIKVYLKKYDPKLNIEKAKQDIFNQLIFFEANSGTEYGKEKFKNNLKITLKQNDFQHGLFTKRGENMYSPSYENALCVYTKDNPCLLIKAYAMAETVKQYSICTKLDGLDTCGAFGSPIKAKTFDPIQYSNSDFYIVKNGGDWQNDGARLKLWLSYRYHTVSTKPGIKQLQPLKWYFFNDCDEYTGCGPGKCFIMALDFGPSFGRYSIFAGGPYDSSTIYFTYLQIPAPFGIPLVGEKQTRSDLWPFWFVDRYGNEQTVSIGLISGKYE